MEPSAVADAPDAANDCDTAHSAAETAHDLQIERVAVATLHRYHRNPRQGSVAAIRDSLRVNGQYKPVVVNRGTFTSRPSEVLAGNHTLAAARDLGWSTVAVTWVDVDEDAAARIVAADNRTGDLGGYDNRLLAELLGDLPDLAGTGFDESDLDDLTALLQEESDPEPDDDAPSASTHRQTPTLDEQADRYADRDTRQIILTYPTEQFERIIGQLSELAERFELDSNSDVIAHVLDVVDDLDSAG